jgi:hypothetical protein
MILRSAFQYLQMQNGSSTVEIVSVLTDMGLPAIAYRVATELNYQTIGIACSLANNHKLYPVDEMTIVGDQWGDESETFLSSIDVLVRVGGGEQSEQECISAKERSIPTMEFELPSLEDAK